jgi:hypothetical protein
MPSESIFVPSDGSDSLANDRRALMAELDMPPDASWKRFFEPGDWRGSEWAGWTVDNFGMSAPTPSGWPPPWPYLLLQSPGMPGSVLIQVWRTIVQAPDCPLRLERRWHPDHGDRIDIKGLERKHTQHDISLASRGIELLALSARQGRSHDETDDAVLATFVELADAWLDRHPNAKPDDLQWSHIHEMSYLSWSRFDATRSDHKIEIDHVKRGLRSR